MASPQEQASVSDVVRFQSQQMTQLLAAINGLVTLQTAATLAPPTPPPVPTPSPMAPPFRAFSPDVERWPEYIVQLEAHFVAYNIPGTEWLAFFIANAGVVLYRVLVKLFPTTRPETKTYDEVIDILNSYFRDSVNVVHARYKFFCLRRGPTQSNKSWLAHLQGLSSDCDFNFSFGRSYADIMIRDTIAQNVADHRIREQILRFKNTSLQEVVNLLDTQDTLDMATSTFDVTPGVYC
ncbi:uncharacterized protein LOC124719359 [Schistocerca piceifrons]|uniref:uncharacterized protein LOC124719359 n=1 Tax=Schistocerca piceifrons TaxID=274613 RepID=UPI001F5EACEF|nr:uncharacterized protein LOC124719359 [Schistocerca piceifrons]